MILLDGVLHEGRSAPFDLADRGLTLGDGLFETMTAFGGTVWRLDDHLERILGGLDVLGFKVPRQRLADDVRSLASRAPASGAVLRLTVTRGAGARGLAPPDGPRPTVIVSAAPFDPVLMFQPASLAVSAIRRNDTSPLSRLKSLGYLDNVLALADARRRGASDALMLNTGGQVACASVANVFCLKGDRLETPPVEDGVLAGIVRGRLFELAPAQGLAAVERSLVPADLLNADAVFLTNSVRLIQPVAELDGIRLPTSPMVARLYDALAGEILAETARDPRG
jgi:branched-chain amino acid aminotransferase